MNGCLSGTTCDGADAELMFYPLLHHKFTLTFHYVPAHPHKKMVIIIITFVFGSTLQKVDRSSIKVCFGIKVYSVIMLEWLELNLPGAGYFLFIDMKRKYYLQVIKITKRCSNRILLYDTYKLEIVLAKYCFLEQPFCTCAGTYRSYFKLRKH